MNVLDIFCVTILIIIVVLLGVIQLVWYVEKKLSNISVKLPTIKVEKPCILLEINENASGKFEVAARNPRDRKDYYQVMYY